MNKILKKQIEKVIQVYVEACKKENLNYNYCIDKRIYKGICFYCIVNKFNKLLKVVESKTDSYLCNIPMSLFSNDYYGFDKSIKNPTLLKCHKARIKFLKELLKDQKL
jgi:hypothetical protein